MKVRLLIPALLCTLLAPRTALARGWQGTWSWATPSSASTLTIVPNEGGFTFEIHASHGINVGELRGAATFESKTRAVGRVLEGQTACSLTFNLTNTSLVVETNDCDALGGLGTSFGGTYVSGVAEVPPMPSLFEQGVLYSKSQQESFSRIVGGERFDMAVGTEGGADADGFGAKVTAGGPPHMLNVFESIVMAAPSGLFWAATVDKDPCELRYYTNAPEWRNKLPVTISRWAADWRGCTVVFATP